MTDQAEQELRTILFNLWRQGRDGVDRYHAVDKTEKLIAEARKGYVLNRPHLRLPEGDTLESIENDLVASFEQFRRSEGYASGTSASSLMAAQQFVTRIAKFFDDKVCQRLVQAVEDSLQRIQSKGHGGGNWRRLIEQELTKLPPHNPTQLENDSQEQN